MNLEAINDRYPEHFVEMGRVDRARYPLSQIPLSKAPNRSRFVLVGDLLLTEESARELLTDAA